MTLSPEARAAWCASFEIECGNVPAWLADGVRKVVAGKANPIATLQAAVAERYPDPAARMLALADPQPGTPEAALFNAVVGKPAAFVADQPDTFTRVEPLP